MDKAKDKKLYLRIKKKADVKFKTPTSAYKSAWIIKEYKKNGGKFKENGSKNLKRWFDEKWVNLNNPIKKNGKIIGYKPCGQRNSKGNYPLCRPSIRKTKETPKTYKEVSKRKISKLNKEKQIVKGKGRISFKLKGGGSIRSQYYGRNSSIMIKVPKSVKSRALYAFKLRDKYGFKGGIETGWKRAKQLATKESIPIQDVKYMRAWFARHIKTSYPSYKSWKEKGSPKEDNYWKNKHGIIAYLIWGGTPAYNWINSSSVRNKLKNYYGKDFPKV